MVFIQSIRTWIYHVYHTSLVVPRYIMFIIQVESYLYISLLYTSLVVTRFIIDIIKVKLYQNISWLSCKSNRVMVIIV